MSKSITSFFLPLPTTSRKKTTDDAEEKTQEKRHTKKQTKRKPSQLLAQPPDQQPQDSDSQDEPRNKRSKPSGRKKEPVKKREARPPSPPAEPDQPVTIDLTLDSPEAKRAETAKSFTRPTRSETTTKQTDQPGPAPHIIDLAGSPAKDKPAAAAVACKTFADFAALRRQKTRRNARPVVDAAWPSAEWVHQRFLDAAGAGPERASGGLRLATSKGKKPVRRWGLELGDDAAEGWMAPIGTDGGDAGPAGPTLVRLALAPPTTLIPGLETDPCFRHPLLARLLKPLSWPLPGPAPLDLPALRRGHHRSPDAVSQLWTTTFAPKRAAEILGDHNRQCALTLKSWLLEIALKEASHSTPDHSHTPDQNQAGKKGATKRRKKKKKQKTEEKKRVIIRAVSPRKRKKARRLVDGDDESDGLDDFIVSDSDEDTIYAQDISVSDGETGAICGGSSPRKRQRSVSVLHPAFAPTAHQQPPAAEVEQETRFEFEHLTNLILLKGPHGVGKSCTVQAVAHELGWEVFEVNPSQLRSRKEVDRLIGDVSKNHVLSCSAKQRPALFKPSCATPIPISSKPPAGAPINPFEKMMKATREQPPPQAAAPEPPGSKKTKQSLILLEEVDIVYGQDKEFWAGVVELVSKSMRPVVMTCTDSSVVPVASLPIQTVLEFEPAGRDLVSAFLEVVCLVEGHLVGRAELGRMYGGELVYDGMAGGLSLMRAKRAAAPFVELFQEPAAPSLPQPDLRRTLCQLQFLCQWAVGSRCAGVDWLDLAPDRAARMLFSENTLPRPPAPAPTLLRQLDPAQDPFARFEKHDFELDWLPPLSGPRPPPPPPAPSDPAHALAQELRVLAQAHEDLSFGDAYVDKDHEVEVEQFEGEIEPCGPDAVLLSASPTAAPGGTIVEIKRPWKASAEGSTTVLGEDALEGQELLYQHVSARRPFTGPHYRREQDAFQALLQALVRGFWARPVPAHAGMGSHGAYVARFFTPFSHARLLQARRERLGEMDGLMDFRGSRAFLQPLAVYLTEYGPFVRLVVAAQAAPAPPPAVTRSARLTRAHRPQELGPVRGRVLELSPDELALFRNASFLDSFV